MGFLAGLFGGTTQALTIPSLSARDIVKETSSADPISPLLGGEKKVGTTGKDALLIDLDNSARTTKTQQQSNEPTISSTTSTTYYGIGSQE